MNLSHQLHPTKIEQLGLVVAVRGLCGEMSHAHGVDIEFTAEQVPPRSPADTALCLYRITQEALRNVIKHSGSRHARVELRGSLDAITLCVSDDGCGFDTGRADRGGSRAGQHEGEAPPGRRGHRVRVAALERVQMEVRIPMGYVRQPPAGRGFTRATDRCIMSDGNLRVSGETAMRRPRVLLADDHRLVREAFARLLECACDVVGAVGDGRALLEAASDLRPDIVVLDISMPLLNGLDAGRQLKQPHARGQADLLDGQRGSRSRRRGIPRRGIRTILKNSAASELLKSIQEVPGAILRHAAGHPRAGRFLAPRPRSSAGSATEHRQREVLQLLAEGRTMKEIARIIKITPRTVAFHKYSIMHELGIKTAPGWSSTPSSSAWWPSDR